MKRLSTVEGVQSIPYEDLADDALISEDDVFITDLNSEGVTEGIVGDDGCVLSKQTLGKGIFFDETPIQKDDGSFNHENVVISHYNGTDDMFMPPNVDVLPAKFKFVNKIVSDDIPYEFQINDSDAKTVTVTIQFSRLYREDGVDPNKVGIKIYLKRDTVGHETAYKTVINRGVQAKLLSPYRESYTIVLDKSEVPEKDSWSVKIEKLELGAGPASPTDTDVTQDVMVSSYYWTYEHIYIHPTSAYTNIRFTSETLGSLPKRGFHMKGQRVQVPNNYSPENGKSKGLLSKFFVGENFENLVAGGIKSLVDFDFAKDSPFLHNHYSGFSIQFSGFYQPDSTSESISLIVGGGSGSVYLDVGNGLEKKIDSANSDRTYSFNLFDPTKKYPIFIEGSYGSSSNIDSTFELINENKKDIVSVNGRQEFALISNKNLSIDNTEEKQYDGIWDGQFFQQKIYTNNPAWIYYDIQTSERYGLGRYIKRDYIDKWGLYEISQACDELVLIPERANLYLSDSVSVGGEVLSVNPLEKPIKAGSTIYLSTGVNSQDRLEITTTHDAYRGATGVKIEPVSEGLSAYVSQKNNGVGAFSLTDLESSIYLTEDNPIGTTDLKVAPTIIDMASGTKLKFQSANGGYFYVHTTQAVSSGATSIPITPLSKQTAQYSNYATPNADKDLKVYGGNIYQDIPDEAFRIVFSFGYLHEVVPLKESITLPAPETPFEVSLAKPLVEDAGKLVLIANDGYEIPIEVLNDSHGTSPTIQYFGDTRLGQTIRVANAINTSDTTLGELLTIWGGQVDFIDITGYGEVVVESSLVVTTEVASLSATQQFDIEPTQFSLKSGTTFYFGNTRIVGTLTADYPAGTTSITATFPESSLGANILPYQEQSGKTYFGEYQAAEPRFTCNTYIQDYREAYQAIIDFNSTFRALVFWAGGRLISAQDLPNDPIVEFSNSNVKDGTFTYSSTAIKDRANLIKVRYNNPDDLYRVDITQVQDIDEITKYGIREKEVTAFATTSKYQAERLGRYILETDNKLTEMVNFTAGIEGKIVFPGSVCKIFDYNRHNIRNGGRISSINGSTLTIDRKISLAHEHESRYYFSGEMYHSGPHPYSYFKCVRNHSGDNSNKTNLNFWQKYCVEYDAGYTWMKDDVAFTGDSPSTFGYYQSKVDNNTAALSDSNSWGYSGASIDLFKLSVVNPSAIMAHSGAKNSQEYSTGVNVKQYINNHHIHMPMIGPATGDKLYLNQEPTGIKPNYLWMVESAGVPRVEKYRIISVDAGENQEANISAVIYKPEIFDEIDNQTIEI